MEDTASQKGKLYLIPMLLGETDIESVMPASVREVIDRLDTFIVENEKTARRYIRKMCKEKVIDTLTLFPLNKFTEQGALSSYLEPCLRGKDVGIICEAGVPAVADPGADVVRIAHTRGIRVIPMVGPSSILLSVMASGLNGQSFCFNGYLPVNKSERIQKLKELEKISADKGQTQLFIETPYRNGAMLDDILSTCHPSTDLCLACDLTTENEYIRTQSVEGWRKSKGENLDKRPAIFLLLKRR